MLCRKCKGTNLEYSKWIQWGRTMGNTYHYKIKCLDCRINYSVKRDGEMFNLTKDKKWQMSRLTKKNVIRNNATNLFPYFFKQSS